MKLSFKTILPILLIFTLLILFAGCGAITPSPGYTPGTITGIIAAPCCSTSADPVPDPCCIAPEYWCYYCENTWSLQDNIEVILTYGEDEIATVFTNEDGEYNFTNVAPGKNYVITALCPDYDDDRPLVKDVALEVVEGETFDAKITDCVSTSLGLVVDFLVTYTELGPEEIVLDEVIAGNPNFWGFPRFKKLVLEVCRAEGECVNLNTDEDVQDALCKAAEEVGQIVIPDLDLGCGPGYTPGPPPTDPCDGNVKPVIDSVLIDGNLVSVLDTIKVVIGVPYVVTVNASDDGIRYDLTYSATANDIPVGAVASNVITITPLVAGTFTIYLYVNDGCATTPWGPVTVKICPPLKELVLTIDDADGTVCSEDCVTISKVTVKYDDATPDLEITDLTDAHLDWTVPSGVSFDEATGEVCLDGGSLDTLYTINVDYTDDCEETAQGSVGVTFEDCCPVAVLDDLEFRVKLPSNGSDFEDWTDMFGYLTNPDFDSNTFYYEITTNTSGAPKFGFRTTGCDTLSLEYNWYRGESCTGKWLTGEYDAAPNPLDDPPSWRSIESAGIYPELDSENSLCNHGGNILKIKVTTISGDENIYTIVINRVVS